MHGESLSHKIRSYSRAAGPCPYHAFLCFALRNCYKFFFPFTALYDQLVAPLVCVTGAFAFSILTGTAARVSPRCTAFTTTHRVIYRVHRYTTVTRAYAFP